MLEQVGPEFFDTAGALAALSTGSSRLTVDGLSRHRADRQLLGLQTADEQWIYPTWQFVDGTILHGLSEALGAFAGAPAWSVAVWLTTPLDDLNKKSPVTWLQEHRDAQELLELARMTAGRWAG